MKMTTNKLAKATVHALIAALMYTPLLGSMNGTVAAAQAVQNTTTKFSYDAVGNLTLATDPLNRYSDFSIDTFGRMTRRTDPPFATGQARNTIQLYYSAADQLSTVLDPRARTDYVTDGLGQRSKLQSNDTGIATMTHDSAGNLKTRTDARSKVTTFSYDALNRLIRTAYASGVASDFEYDGGASGAPSDIGHLTKMSDESGETTYAYNGNGKLLSKVQLSKAPSGAMATLGIYYSYGTEGSSLDKLTSLTYPSGNRINYSYDAGGRIEQLTLNPGNGSGGTDTATTTVLLSAISYNAAGAIVSWNWGNHSVATPNTYLRSYDLDGRLTSYPLGSASANGLLRTVNYDAASQITSMTHSGTADAANYDQTLTYDDLSRLRSYSTATASLGYTYDANGNRTQLRVGTTTYNSTITASTNRQASTTGPAPARSNSFDAAGNILSDGTRTFVYGDNGRMKRSTKAGVSTDYLYNGQGERVSKAGTDVAGAVQFLAFDVDGKVLGEYATVAATPVMETVFLGATPVAALARGEVHYVYADHIDTPRMLTNSADNAIVWRWDQADPFGASMPNENPTGAGPFVYNLRFPGQVYDKESGLHYNYYRDYDPQTGRYVQSDPIGLEGGINTYAYVEGNPMSLVDAFGLAPVVDRYPTVDKAGIQAIRDINAKSISEDREYAGRIFQNPDGSFGYTAPIRGQKKTSDFGQCPPGKKNAGQYHTHGKANPAYLDEVFAYPDMWWADQENVPSYLGTPSGNIGKYTPNLLKGAYKGQAKSIGKVGK
jgi:RHS repeat-associated protein